MTDDLLPPSEHESATVRDAADRILASDEFTDDRSVIRRFAEWLVDRLADLFDGVGEAGGAAGWFGSAIRLALVALVVAAVVLGLRALWRTRRLGTRGSDDTGLAVVLGELGDPDVLGDRVARARAAGDWRAALLAEYRLLVATLVLDGVLGDAPGRTTGEYLTEFTERRPGDAAPFASATHAFEACYYGHRAADAADADALAETRRMLVAEPAGARR